MLAYLVVILITPALTRLYAPEQFGTVSLTIFVSSFLAVLFTVRLELAIPLIKDQQILDNLIKALLCSTLLLSVISSFILLLLIDDILTLFFGTANQGNWLLTVPFYAAALAINSILMMFLAKEKDFQKIGLSLLFQNCTFCLLALILSKFNINLNGLIVAKFFGLGMSIVFASMVLKYKIKKIFFFRPKFKLLKKANSKLKQFVQYNVPISIMGIVGKDLMILIFTFSQGVAYAGFYAVARVVSELPTSVLSSALGPVFYSQTASSLNGSILEERVLKEIKLILKLLLTLVIPVYLFCSIWALEIFKLLFGEAWEKSGTIFLFLLPLGILSLFSCWLTRLFEVVGQQNRSFKIQFTFEACGFAIALLMVFLGFHPQTILAVVVTCFSLIPILITLFSFKILGIKPSIIKLLGCFFIIFSFSNSLIFTIFPNDFGQDIQTQWLIISSILFFFLGQKLFKEYSFRDLNVFN